MIGCEQVNLSFILAGIAVQIDAHVFFIFLVT